jgi:hypothetical protein
MKPPREREMDSFESREKKEKAGTALVRSIRPKGSMNGEKGLWLSVPRGEFAIGDPGSTAPG